VFTVGSFIYGLSGDTPETVRKLRRRALELSLDHPFFIPLTPLPGTPFWRPEMWDPTGEKFRSYGFLPGSPVNGCRGGLARALLFSDLFYWNRARLANDLRGIFHHDVRKRRLSRRLILRSGIFEARRLLKTVLGRKPDGGMYFPRWYDS
jgi:radical SAM superfamily enzyme YgiQ (UPF0313 family)